MSLSFLRRRPPDPALLYGLLVTPLKQGPLLMSVSACALLQSSCRSGCYATFLDIAVAVPHGTREVVQCTPPFSIRSSLNVRFGSLADITTRSRHVRFPSRADIRQCGWDVRYVPEADIFGLRRTN